MSILTKVDLHLEQQLPFVLYSLPNSNLICGLFQQDDFKHHFNGESGFVFASFSGDETIVIPENKADYFEENLPIHSYNTNSEFEKYDEKANQHFENIVEKAIDSIQSNLFEKVVLSRKIEIEKRLNLSSTFLTLCHQYPTAFRSLFYHPKVGCWMGATPEQLIKVENNQFETVSLAGTHTKNNFTNWSTKEIDEQQIVTDYIVNSLQDEVISLNISEPFTVEAGSLVHLKSIISGEVHSLNNIKNCVQKLHPTPAVCGFPKDKAIQFIIENENYNRKFYAGYLGLWNSEKSTANLFVNLRCLEITKDKVIIYVGCGITKDSNPEKEFFETEHKSMTMRTIL